MDLYYIPEDHIWARVSQDGIVTVGLTDVAQSMAGAIIHVHLKKVGMARERGKPIATVESGKWVGPVKTPVGGEIVEINTKLETDASLLNKSPYKEGWISRVKPANLDADIALMLKGEAAVAAYQKIMEEKKLKDCIHCEGYEV
jgi:glycine cleavage system H protein